MKKLLHEENNERESLFNIIRNIAKEEFTIYKSNIKELISSNVNKTNECLDKLSSEFGDLTANLEFTPPPPKKKKMTREIKDLKTEVKAIEDDLSNADEVSLKLIEYL